MYKDQKYSNLKLNLIKDIINESNLNILKKEKKKFGKINVLASIIGESHFITFDINGIIFSEMLACISYKKGEEYNQNIFLDDIININNSVKYKLDQNYLYEFKYKILDSSNAILLNKEFIKRASNIIKDKRVYLSYDFISNNSLKAMTNIFIYEIDNGIEIKTLHTYPNEFKAVLSHSTIINSNIYSKKVFL